MKICPRGNWCPSELTRLLPNLTIRVRGVTRVVMPPGAATALLLCNKGIQTGTRRASFSLKDADALPLRKTAQGESLHHGRRVAGCDGIAMIGWPVTALDGSGALPVRLAPKAMTPSKGG